MEVMILLYYYFGGGDSLLLFYFKLGVQPTTEKRDQQTAWELQYFV